MTTAETIRIGRIGVLEVDTYPQLELRPQYESRHPYVDVDVRISDRTVGTIESAGECSRERDGGFSIAIDYFAGRAGEPFLFVFGIFDVWQITAGESVLRSVALFRGTDFDPGYYDVKIHERADVFDLRYESGVCRMSYSGTVLWHVPLKWDDLYVREEDGVFVYSNEHLKNGKEWRIRLRDGKVLS